MSLAPDDKVESHLLIDQTVSSVASHLAQHAGLTIAAIKDAMQKGAVWLTHGNSTRRIRRASKTLAIGDELHLYYDPRILKQQPPTPALVAEESDYSVWFKPYGLYSQGSKWGDHCTIHRWIETHAVPQRPAFIVHRLDRAASGIMVIAHTKSAAKQLAGQFERREVEKRYRVIVHGKFPSQKDGWLITEPLDAKVARSRATRLGFDPGRKRSLLSVEIETGRKHQIRRHLTGIGFPVVGDRLYGRADDKEDLQLMSVQLGLMDLQTGKKKSYGVPEAQALSLNSERP
ncbi:MAG: RluA family pseudouridine synthase [bacterium]